MDISSYATNRTVGEQCHDALIETGAAKGAAFRAERLYKRTRDTAYLMQSGTVPEREAKARTLGVVVSHEDAWIQAEVNYNVTRAKSDALEVLFEEYRSRQATSRAEMQLK